MKRFARAAAAAALLASAALLSGCSTDATPLARVGDQTVTVGDYRTASLNAAGRYQGTPDSARTQLMDDLVRRALMLHYAHTSGIIVDSLLDRFRDQTERQAVVGVLGNRLVPRSIPVSEAEIRTLHAQRDSASHLHVIFTPDRVMADAARAAIGNGEPFAITASRFNPAGMMPPGGDFDFRQAGDLVDPLDAVMRNAKVGELVGPIEAPGEGWFLLLVSARRAEEPVSLEEARPTLTQMIRQRKRRALSMAAFQSLREAYRLEVLSGAAQRLRSVLVAGGRMFGMAAPEPTPQERAQPLARWNGGPGLTGVYTLGDALDDLDSGIQERPNADMLSTFKPWIEARAIQRLAVMEAKRRRIQDEPDVARQIRDEVDGYLLQTVYNDVVTMQVTEPEEGDYRTVWEEFDVPDKGDFESMSDAIRQHLTPEALRVASERRLIAFTDSLRQAVPVRIDERRLRALPKPSTVLLRS